MALEAHQFLPSFGWRDAVGTHTLQTRRALAEAGIKGRIWSEEIQSEMAKSAGPPEGYAGLRSARRGGNVLLYQASTGSHGMVETITKRPEPKTLYYHNVTPARFFEDYVPAAALNLTWGRQELGMLAPHVRVGMANSEFSAEELRALGIEDVRVIPPYLPPTAGAAADATYASWLRRTKRGIDVLAVGRVVPHKGHVHLLRAFAALRAAVDPGARLLIVGAWGPEAYMRALFGLREHLGLERVAFTGSVSEASLAAHYQEADVYLSLSEHEGFGLPLIEAMRHSLPVVAYAGGAVEETLDGAGLLLPTLDPPTVAEVLGRVATDDALRAAMVKGQRERVAEVEAFPRDEHIVRAVRDAAHTV
ncbi:MAG: glycosyltransferase family 4 protein [Acidimicrobiales bacterium]